ncbi:hypothetical protein FB451DRAFT_1190899 [Mycena latifolia]|nr:hypothetical protein FB451DRAFT_1190899 [Mycena latifolia]
MDSRASSGRNVRRSEYLGIGHPGWWSRRRSHRTLASWWFVKSRVCAGRSGSVRGHSAVAQKIGEDGERLHWTVVVRPFQEGKKPDRDVGMSAAVTQPSNQLFVPIPPAPTILLPGVDVAQLVQLFDLVKSAGQNNGNMQEHSRKEAGDKAQASPSAKPPENRKQAKPADKNNDWRTKATVGSDYQESSDEEVEPKPVKKPARRHIILDDDFSDEEPPPVPYRRLGKGSKAHVKDPLPVATEKAFRLVAPVERAGAVDELNERIKETRVDVRLGDLWGMAPELAKKLRKSITKTRQPYAKPKLVGDVLAQGALLPFEDEVMSELEYDAIDMDELPRVDSLYVATEEDVGVPLGSLVVPDPYMQYLASLGENEQPKQVCTMPTHATGAFSTLTQPKSTSTSKKATVEEVPDEEHQS